MPDSKASSPLRLVSPSLEYLSSYVAALERGWSPNNLRPEVAQEELAQILADSRRFLASLVDREAKGLAVKLPDGTTVPHLPGYKRWLWDGEFCGSISLRWQNGTNNLPDYCLGHIGYGVVPWKRGRGFAKEALRSLLLEVRSEGLTYVEVTTSPDNFASQSVIRANGGVFMEEFIKGPALGGTAEQRFRIELGPLP